MRRFVVALGLTALTSGALAADYEVPTLRGSSPFVPAPPLYTLWDGFYVGGQLGYSSAHVDFSQATRSMVAFSLRETALENEGHVSDWVALGSTDKQGFSFGGFFGYNWQFDDVILGMDVNYNKTALSASASSLPIRRALAAGGNAYDVTVAGTASLDIRDFATARVRGGFILDSVLPYATFGLAVGRASVARSTTVSGTENPGTPQAFDFSFISSETKNNAFIYGLSGGLGIDFLIFPNWFVRAEYEYVRFFDIYGIKPQVQTGRTGVAFKF